MDMLICTDSENIIRNVAERRVTEVLGCRRYVIHPIAEVEDGSLCVLYNEDNRSGEVRQIKTQPLFDPLSVRTPYLVARYACGAFENIMLSDIGIYMTAVEQCGGEPC